jgi:choline dehydrogenase
MKLFLFVLWFFCIQVLSFSKNDNREFRFPRNLLNDIRREEESINDIDPPVFVDFIVVGAGAGGSVVAARLTENPSITVALLEAGGSYEHTSEPVSIPFLWATLQKTSIDWNYYEVASPTVDDRQIQLPRGRILGGSTAINAMNYVRGRPQDYNNWVEKYGAVGWSYEDVLPYFIKSENQKSILNSTVQGYHGPLTVQFCDYIFNISKVFYDAGLQAGYNANYDYNSGFQEGFTYYQKTINGIYRESSFVAYLEPNLNRTNLKIFRRATALRVLFDERKNAVGVVALQDGRLRYFFAFKEVIVSGGSINTPQLLMLSGVGPKEELEQFGIPVIYDSPYVGKNLQDQPIVYIYFNTTLPPIGPQLGEIAEQYFTEGKGPFTCGGGDIGAFIRSNDSLPLNEPDIQILSVGFNSENLYESGFGPFFALINPKSPSGEVKINSADPLERPNIYNHFFESPEDIQAAISTIRKIRYILSQPAFDGYRGEPFGLGPTDDQVTDEQLTSYILSAMQSFDHPVGTCRMGSDPNTTVVDPHLIVRGVQRLRVIDASIMPHIISGNTQAPTYMIGEKGAALIKEYYNI